MNSIINHHPAAACGLAGAFALAFATLTPTAEGAWCFSKIVSLGDSLSDVGNFYDLTGGTTPPAPYFEGRFSDGPIWNEYLGVMLGTELESESQYALGGSLTGDMNLNSIPPSFVLPGFEQQVDGVIAENGRKRIDPRALYTIWVGANDFFAWIASGNTDPNPMIENGVANTIQGVGDLADAGAHYVMVFNLPDLGKTPTALSFGPVMSSTLSFLCNSYNEQLEQELNLLEKQRRSLKIVQVDAFTLINHMVTSAELYGFTNVTEAATDNLPSANPDEYLFWDGVHPTTAAHEYVADAALQQLELKFRGIHHRGRRMKNFRGRVYDSARWTSCFRGSAKRRLK